MAVADDMQHWILKQLKSLTVLLELNTINNVAYFNVNRNIRVIGMKFLSLNEQIEYESLKSI